MNPIFTIQILVSVCQTIEGNINTKSLFENAGELYMLNFHWDVSIHYAILENQAMNVFMD